MSDYISRKWLSNAIHNFFNGLNHNVTEEDIQAYINATPDADVRENVRGKWRDTGSGQECSVCKEIQYGYDNFRFFCAHCGADMRW